MTGHKNKHTAADRNVLHDSYGSFVVGDCESKSLHADAQLEIVIWTKWHNLSETLAEVRSLNGVFLIKSA